MTLHNTRFLVENKESLNNRESVDEKISLENPVLHLHVLLLHLQAHKLIFSEIWVLLKKKNKEVGNSLIHFHKKPPITKFIFIALRLFNFNYI